MSLHCCGLCVTSSEACPQVANAFPLTSTAGLNAHIVLSAHPLWGTLYFTQYVCLGMFYSFVKAENIFY